MHVLLNGIHLRHVLYRKTDDTRETLRFIDQSPDIESELRIGALITVFPSNVPIEGTIVHYEGSPEDGYEVTIKKRALQ